MKQTAAAIAATSGTGTIVERLTHSTRPMAANPAAPVPILMRLMTSVPMRSRSRRPISKTISNGLRFTLESSPAGGAASAEACSAGGFARSLWASTTPTRTPVEIPRVTATSSSTRFSDSRPPLTALNVPRNAAARRTSIAPRYGSLRNGLCGDGGSGVAGLCVSTRLESGAAARPVAAAVEKEDMHQPPGNGLVQQKEKIGNENGRSSEDQMPGGARSDSGEIHCEWTVN